MKLATVKTSTSKHARPGYADISLPASARDSLQQLGGTIVHHLMAAVLHFESLDREQQHAAILALGHKTKVQRRLFVRTSVAAIVANWRWPLYSRAQVLTAACYAYCGLAEKQRLSWLTDLNDFLARVEEGK